MSNITERKSFRLAEMRSKVASAVMGKRFEPLFGHWQNIDGSFTPLRWTVCFNCFTRKSVHGDTIGFGEGGELWDPDKNKDQYIELVQYVTHLNQIHKLESADIVCDAIAKRNPKVLEWLVAINLKRGY